MANRYANLVGTKKISEDFNNINIGFDRVQAEMDTKGTPADAQAKADAAKAAAIAAAAADLAAHKARGADEHPAAKGNAAGFMSAADKLIVDARTSAATPDTLMQRDAAGRAKVTAPAAAGDIARKAETDAVQTNLDSHAADMDIHVTADDHDKLDGIAAGAEVNQNAFAKVNDVEASSKSDTLQFRGGTGITVTTDPASKQVTVTATGEATPGAHASSHVTGGADVIPDAVTGGASGLMSGADAKFVRVDGETKTGAQAKADAVKAYVDGKLDTPERTAITLQPGIQVVQADQDSPFSLTGLTGRTLVNLLGRAGGCESISGWTKSTSASIELSTTNVNSGSNNFKVTQSGTAGQSYVRTPVSTTARVNPANHYIALAWIKNDTAQSFSARLVAADGSAAITGAKSGTILAGAAGIAWRAYTPTEMGNNTGVVMDVYTAGSVIVGAAYYVDSFRIYQIGAAEYDALDSMTPEQVAVKYPYVDSVQPVRNPYAIRYGENLLPPFYEWNVNTIGISKVVSPYESVAEITSAGTISPLRTVIPVLPNTTYTISSEGASVSNGVQIIERKDSNDADSSGEISGGYFDNVPGKVAVGTVTFTTSEQTRYLAIRLRYDAVGTHTIKNPMLTIGTTAKPFNPREDPMLALQTDLYADPLTGANADQVFEKDGQYFKLAKWKKVVLDGSLAWVYSSTWTGYKRVGVSSPFGSEGVTGTQLVTKFDGKSLTNIANNDMAAGDQVVFDTSYASAKLQLSIPNTDSGWGDAYAPTADEIKAYFMGWIMYLSGTGGSGKSGITPYNGTGTKYWARVAADGNTLADGTSVLPTTQAPNFTPYQLVYQLATPTVEPIMSEGQLTLIEGSNQVEVGTGMVTRESNKPGYVNGIYYFNDTYYGSPLKYKVDKVMAVYKNNVRDYKAVIYVGTNQYGNQKANLKAENYDPTATYSITYLMLDTSPVAAFIGSIPDNEKALLTDLVQDVQQANARLSVVESKKAEKDSPAWITPTLVNGWIQYPGYPTAQYVKDSSEYVHIRGLIKGGVRDAGKRLFVLPEGFRPKTRRIFNVLSFGTTTPIGTTVEITEDGNVYLGTSASETWLNLEGISFNINL